MADCYKQLSLTETHQKLPGLRARPRRAIANNIIDLKQRSISHPSFLGKRRVVDYSSNDVRYRHPSRRRHGNDRIVNTEPSSQLLSSSRYDYGVISSMNPKVSYATTYHEMPQKATIRRKAIGKKFRYGKTKQYSWPTASFVQTSSPYLMFGPREYTPYDESSLDLKAGEEDFDYVRMMDNGKSEWNNLNSLPGMIEQQPYQQPAYIPATAAAAPSYVQLASQSFPLVNYYSPSQVTSTTISRNAIPLDVPYANVQRASPNFLAAPVYDAYDSTANLNNVFGALQCFSGDMTVETPEGIKSIRALRIGDNVLSIDGSSVTAYCSISGHYLSILCNIHFQFLILRIFCINFQEFFTLEQNISYSPVIMFLHRLDDEIAEFNLLTMTDCCEKRNETNHLQVVDSGIYAPLTTTGKIFINSVLSSCHSNVVLETLQQTFFTQIKRFNSWFREWWTSTEQDKCDSSKCDEQLHLPFGVEYLTTVLDLIVPHETFMR
ncbi:unnamed protein product [Anisakis simplex]|uniref:Warthog protein 6 (inferred by orthology to a C. elegans protein) n=1 Tax=Anisakis simplex TaxID=6269 RepID=A0A0M3JU24_ANISI|nr:unnamed protein product [Anisakis simplex]